MISHHPSAFTMGIVLLIAAVGAVAYVSGGPASFLGHSPGEVENDFVTVSRSCNNVATQYKYCEALCPSGYYATSGSCRTVVNDFPNNDSGYQYNLLGVSPDLKGWSCFNGDLANDPNEYVEASVVCARSGGYTAIPYQFCGNYRIEPSTGQPGSVNEVCDTANLGGWLDCTNFKTSGGNALCNGSVSCGSSCGGFDVSQCVYCNGGCMGGQTLCGNGTCQDDCTGSGGNAPGSKLVGPAGNNCLPGQNCLPVPDTWTTPGFCGNGVLTAGIPEAGEECDGDDSFCASHGTLGVICPDGTSVSSGYVCSSTCSCEPNPTPCCNGPSGPDCTDNYDCGLAITEFGLAHGICVLGCCVYG
jgi:hypothetical protein